jgi:predicted enzyme related to lactoylglutathione lyase
VFGWESQQLPEMNYATFMSQETLGGGFNPITKDNPAGTVTVYVGTDDIGTSLAKINAAGGKTIAPQAEMPGMGWFAIVKDPTWNTLALFKEMSK